MKSISLDTLVKKNDKIEKFQEALNKNKDKAYRQWEDAKKTYESHVKEFGYDEKTASLLFNIQLREAEIKIFEDTLDDFENMFNK